MKSIFLLAIVVLLFILYIQSDRIIKALKFCFFSNNTILER